MLPRASPVTTSWTYKLLCHGDGHDLAVLPDDHDVVAVGQRVVLLRAEGPPVGLDEPLVLALEVLEGVAHLGSVGASGLLDSQGEQVHAVVGIGGAHGGDHV